MVSKKFTIDSVDWNRLVLRLTSAAIRFIGEREDFVVSGVGNSIEDYVIEAVTTLFDKFHGYNLKGDDDCFALAKTMMERDILDSKKSSSHKTTDIFFDSEDRANSLDELPSDENGLESLERQMLAREYYKYANGEKDLTDIIDAVIYFDELEPRNIAALLGITINDVHNRKKKLKYNRNRKY
jgi:DNA-directed RNA polymerase specialized sigma24 family protein